MTSWLISSVSCKAAILLIFTNYLCVFRIFLWAYKSDQTVPQQDVGRLPRSILLHCHLWSGGECCYGNCAGEGVVMSVLCSLLTFWPVLTSSCAMAIIVKKHTSSPRLSTMWVFVWCSCYADNCLEKPSQCYLSLFAVCVCVWAGQDRVCVCMCMHRWAWRSWKWCETVVFS